MKEELQIIEKLAQYCDEDTAVELNRRLQEILDWVNQCLVDLKDP